MWDFWVVGVFQLIVSVVAVSQPPRLEITFPAQHSWWQVNNDDGLLETLPIYFQTRNFRIPENGFLFVTGNNTPEEGYRHISDANSLFLGGIDPGTHFWKLELRSWNDTSSALAEATLHVEVVVDPSDERSPWRYKLRENEKRPIVLVNPHRHVSSTRGVLPVCYVSSTSSAFDGQRRMWLQIMEGLGRRNTVDFRFEVKTFEKVATDAPFTRALHRLNVSLHGLPLEISRNELSDEEATPDRAIKALLNSFYLQFPTTRNDSRQISMLDRPALLKLHPPYATRVWNDLVDSFSSCVDGLIIFSNSRSLSDKLLVLAARLAGPRAIVMELANLHPTRVDVDILLAPSHFAKEHYSVARKVRAHSKFVLCTGVDTQQFTPSAAPVSKQDHFVIGYVGRLSSEKSVGLLLATMQILAPICSHCRLRVVGDGPQKSQLKQLAAEWGLFGTSVDFVDGIYNNEPALVRKFREMHVFASPMFTETLGLAVLEAMSVGLPVVGFISAGTGEFLEDGLNCVSVTKATPAKFADALLLLVSDNERRLRLGKQARRTVTERFSTGTATEQFARLYKRVGRSSNSSGRKNQDTCALHRKML
ncbi:hypothetical protein Pcac1_g9440 [Phytophthora cactorum]|uniref:Glycosyl transferase family 1 domain-containing protein n=1 Tax=Phytophthora cactorum TaxID=29920 RepID=A0A329SZC3_9STRA|nr:hypothetical protein Pcac1_g9440 [Phytophthora cactorum]RAW40982.1 hypothetical protein PC110_g2794 [Phytophthora cactorum]